MLNSNTVELRWKDNSTDEIGFKVERSLDGVNFKQIALLLKNAQRFTNSGLPAGKTVYYRIRSYNAVEMSGYSNVASITPGGTGGTTGPGSGGAPVTPPPTTTRPPTTPTTGSGPIVIGGTSASSQLPSRTIGTSSSNKTIQQVNI
jgi:hypothetical protein